MPTFKQFKLPDAGEGLTEAEILKWYVQPGDHVTINQALVEIETAKAAVELPSPYAGTVTELLVTEGSTVDVGTPIITVDVDPDGAPGVPAAVQSQPAGEPPATAEALRDDMAPAIPRPADDEPVEPGLIGGPAPGGRTSVLVGYGPRSVVAKRRPRKGAASGNGAATPAGGTGTIPAPEPEPVPAQSVSAASAPPAASPAAARPARPARRPRPRPASRCWPSRRSGSWPRTSGSTSPA